MFNSATLKKDKDRLRKSGYFDSKWYKGQFADVNMTGIDAAEHFLRYGALMCRDPGPNFCTQFYRDTHPGVVRQNLNPVLHHMNRKGAKAPIEPDRHYTLWASFRMTQHYGYETAMQYAEQFLPSDLQYTGQILRANCAISDGRVDDWLASMNTYLSHYALAPVRLKSEDGSLMSRFTTDALPLRHDGPLVSLIMPAWNAESTIMHAARSILNQTWQPLELLIVDDASSDSTWELLKQLAATDNRVKIMRNSINTGPYVAKNIALMHAQGTYVTGHDADDWAHPQRLEKHIEAVTLRGGSLRASLTYMIRMQPDGIFGHIGKVTKFSFDGIARKASISCLFEREFLTKTLGFWDSVRFGADSEMIARTQGLLGEGFESLQQIGMICLDLETSLTNHPDHGVHKTDGVSPIRANYRDSWTLWHKTKMKDANAYLPFPQESRRYDAGEPMVVPYADQKKVVSSSGL